MRIGSHLQKRHNSYRFRFRFPRAIAVRLQLGELVLGLKTDSIREATRRARILRVGIDQLLKELETVNTQADANRLAKRWVDARRADLIERLDTSGCVFFERDDTDRPGADLQSLDLLLRMQNENDIVPDVEHAISRRLSGLDDPRHHIVDAVMEQAFTDLAPSLDPGCREGKVFRRVFLSRYRDWIREEGLLLRGESPGLAETPFVDHVVTGDKGVEKGDFVFLVHWDEFTAYKLREKRWKPENASNGRSSRNLLEAFEPALKLSKITRVLTANFRKSLMKLPRGYDKLKAFKDLSFNRKIARAIEQGLKDEDLLSAKTANKHFGNIIEYWKWLQLEGLIEDTIKNPFTGFIKSGKRGKAAREERHQWPRALEQKLFRSPVWTGCTTIHRRTRSGKAIFRDALFWLPILARTTGARQDELCSLLVEDVKFALPEDFGFSGNMPNIAYLEIDESKTGDSTRDVPLHEIVLLLGFLEYRVYGRAGKEPLFPELIPQGPGQTRAAAFSDRFSYYRKGAEVYHPKVDFHSFRSNVTTDLANMDGLTSGWADEIVGHASIVRKSEGERYTKGIHLTHLKSTIDRIRFPVDLQHLFFTGAPGMPAPHAEENIAMFVELAKREMRKKSTRQHRIQN